MTILITGAAGFIGAAVAERLLAREERVIGIDNFNGYYSVDLKRDRAARLAHAGGAFTLHEIDFSDPKALDRALGETRIDRIIHLGAQAGVRHAPPFHLYRRHRERGRGSAAPAPIGR